MYKLLTILYFVDDPFVLWHCGTVFAFAIVLRGKGDMRPFRYLKCPTEEERSAIRSWTEIEKVLGLPNTETNTDH